MGQRKRVHNTCIGLVKATGFFPRVILWIHVDPKILQDTCGVIRSSSQFAMMTQAVARKKQWDVNILVPLCITLVKSSARHTGTVIGENKCYNVWPKSIMVEMQSGRVSLVLVSCVKLYHIVYHPQTKYFQDEVQKSRLPDLSQHSHIYLEQHKHTSNPLPHPIKFQHPHTPTESPNPNPAQPQALPSPFLTPNNYSPRLSTYNILQPTNFLFNSTYVPFITTPWPPVGFYTSVTPTWPFSRNPYGCHSCFQFYTHPTFRRTSAPSPQSLCTPWYFSSPRTPGQHTLLMTKAAIHRKSPHSELPPRCWAHSASPSRYPEEAAPHAPEQTRLWPPKPARNRLETTKGASFRWEPRPATPPRWGKGSSTNDRDISWLSTIC